MKYLKISNWDTWQTFRKDRGTPGWIKVWRNLFSKPDWTTLTDQEKGQLISMWLVAADRKGKIPNDPQIVQKICQLDQAPDLHRFKALGWVDGQVADACQPHQGGTRPATGNQVVAQRRVEESRVEESRVDKKTLVSKADLWKWQEGAFEILWKQYPRRLKKAGAFARFKNQIKTGEDFDNIKKALVNYKLDTEHQRENGHPDLAWQHGATWFNKNWIDYVNYEKPTTGAKPKTTFEKKRDVVDEWAEEEEKNESQPLQNGPQDYLEPGRSKP